MSVRRDGNQPALAELLGDTGEVGLNLTCEAISESPVTPSGICVVEAGWSFEDSFATGNALPRQRRGKQRVAHGGALAHRASAAARPFEVARGQIDALRDGAVNPVRVEPPDFCGRDCRAENAKDRARMKAARHHRRNEIRCQALHDFVAAHHRREVLPSCATRGFGYGQRGRQNRQPGWVTI